MTQGSNGYDFVSAADVAAQPMRMLWRDRIPAATLSVIAGAPGLGKSSLVAFMVAELSRRGKTVLVSNAEDDIASVTRPRLDAAGAILERVQLVPPDAAVLLPRELASLADWIRATGAACLILDPIAAHFKPERLVHDRPALRKLAHLARTTGCAIVGIHHTTKMGDVGGPNAGLHGTARAVYLYGYDPDDEDRRALSCVKINGFDAPPALIFEHETVEYTAGRKVIEAGRLRKVRESNSKASRSRGRRHEERDAEAHAWLSEYLAEADDCARQANDVRGEGTARGFSWETLRRAKVALEVEHIKRGFGANGFWLWRLPDEHPLRQPAEEEGVPA